jgi:pSer/pThr/pTyr-binding forkhead associated (FHA) protein
VLRCADCGAVHPANTLFCDECGANLQRAPEVVGESSAMPPASAGNPVSSSSEPGATSVHVSLVTPDHTRAFGLELQDTLLIGRTDRSNSAAPDIDLTLLQAVQLGVSRRHARLLRTGRGVALEDLKSLNGTFVCGQRLAPHQPQPLESGNELRFGKVALVISF